MTSYTVTFVTSDNQEFTLPRGVAEQSILVKQLTDEDDDNEVEVSVPIQLTSSIISMILPYLHYHYEHPATPIPKPLPSKDMKDVACEWDQKYLSDLNEDALFQVVLAANYLHIPSLLDLTCAKVATMIKGKTPEQIRQTFNIENDFTPEEEHMLREENKFCE